MFIWEDQVEKCQKKKRKDWRARLDSTKIYVSGGHFPFTNKLHSDNFRLSTAFGMPSCLPDFKRQ